ncbi:MAG: LON peptidase substrate-binding domain-containing protein, partial [Steroidobacteraceae bacterium]
MTEVQASSQDTHTEVTKKVSDDMLIILPVRNMVLFPGTVLPVAINRERTVAGAQEAVRTERKVGFVLQHSPDTEKPEPTDLYRVGTVANVLRYVTTQDGTHHIVAQGERRFRVLDFQNNGQFLLARVEYTNESNANGSEVEARVLNLKRLAAEAISLLPQAPAELANAIQAVESASALADLVSSFMDIKAPDKQKL